MSPIQILLLLALASKSLLAALPCLPHFLVIHHRTLEVIFYASLTNFYFYLYYGHWDPGSQCLRLCSWDFPFAGLLTPSLGPSNPCRPPCHLRFSKPSSHLVFPKLSNRPLSNGIPSARGVGLSTHAQHPLLTSCPLLQQAPFMLPGPQPPCLCSFLAPMLGNQQGMLRPLPAYLNPPNSSKTSSRPSPLCVAS